MTLLSLLTCVLLSALSVQTKVVSDFTECGEFFYRGTEPRGMDRNAVKICQKYENKFHFATLYSTHHRIPLYSAYTFDRYSKEDPIIPFVRPKKWFIEPQLRRSGPADGDEMRLLRSDETEEIKQNQAINGDYMNTGYDRGHLFPNGYAPSGKRRATFTLTNGAPMVQSFNQGPWENLEAELKALLSDELNKHPAGKAYIITGTIPNQNDRIPKSEEGETGPDYERVTVPTHIWTAVCFVDESDQNHPYSFSFGYTAQNNDESNTKVMHFPEMNKELNELYSYIGESRTIRVFKDECNKLTLLEIKVKLEKFLKLALRLQSHIHPDKALSSGRVLLFRSIDEFAKDSESLKSLESRACVLTGISARSWVPGRNKRDVGPVDVWCEDVLEKSIPASRTSADGLRCQDDMRYCQTEKGFKPCCTSPCLYQDIYQNYVCFSGGTLIQCSPQYSKISANGKRCLEEYPCAMYGEDYFWCWTGKLSFQWEYCSPPVWDSRAENGIKCRPNHACAKYGSGHNWCFIDDKGNPKLCCAHDDCFSATYGKTCKSDSPCGKYGKDYLWCETTDGTWETCCKDCSSQ